MQAPLIAPATGHALTLEVTAEAFRQAVTEHAVLASLRAPRKRSNVAKCHLNLSALNEKGAPVQTVPSCGQLNGTQTGPAETHYTLTTAGVTCLKCKRTKRFKTAVTELEARAEAASEELFAQNMAVVAGPYMLSFDLAGSRTTGCRYSTSAPLTAESFRDGLDKARAALAAAILGNPPFQAAAVAQ